MEADDQTVLDPFQEPLSTSLFGSGSTGPFLIVLHSFGKEKHISSSEQGGKKSYSSPNGTVS